VPGDTQSLTLAHTSLAVLTFSGTDAENRWPCFDGVDVRRTLLVLALMVALSPTAVSAEEKRSLVALR
jgi:hypothetical protein